MLNDWMLESSQNFNIVVGLTTVITIGSVLLLFSIMKKFGEPDERTKTIKLKILSFMFSAQLIMNAIFILFVVSDIEYFRQIFLFLQGFVFLIGAIYAMTLYKKDFA